jgi:uncharacterized protein with HEPN domain
VSTKRWQERIDDILQAVAEIDSFIVGMDESSFLADVKTIKAVVANLTIIGEAARYVPDEIALLDPEIPWGSMRGMRNRLVHGYYQVDAQIVWNTCQRDLPAIVNKLEELRRRNP